MRIGFDVSQTGKGKAGCGYYAAGLLQGLLQLDAGDRPELLLYPTFGDFFWDDAWESATLRAPDAKARFFPLHESRAEAEAFWRALPEDAPSVLGSPRIIHANNFFCPRPIGGVGTVYTLYDLSFLEHPEWTTETNRSGCFRGVFSAALYADRFVAISEFTRDHFLAVFPFVPRERVAIAYPGSRFSAGAPASAPRSEPALIPGRFWLAVGTIEPRKNYGTLLRAYARLRSRSPESVPLAIAGGQGWLMDNIRAEIEALRLADHVQLLGYLTDEELVWLYRSCKAFVYPSLWEGFGMPVLEAMSQGAPVITSSVTSLPEVAGDAALLVDPTSEEALADVMTRLESDERLRRTLAAAGPRRATRFTWRAAAEAVAGVYRELDGRLP